MIDCKQEGLNDLARAKGYIAAMNDSFNKPHQKQDLVKILSQIEASVDRAFQNFKFVGGEGIFKFDTTQGTITGLTEEGRTLTELIIPAEIDGVAVTKIGNEAFYNCKSLTSVTIPDTVTSIGGWAFSNTAYYNNPANWIGDVLYLDKWLIEAKDTLSGAYEIKSGTVGIAENAFVYCTSLTSVTIPDGVTSISDFAFRGCTSLTSVTIPDSVTSIGWSAFRSCTSLANIIVPNSVTTIGSEAFAWCESLTGVTMGNSVTEIGNVAFEWCTSLKSVTIPDSVTLIRGGAFYGCKSLAAINVGMANTAYASHEGVLYNKEMTEIIKCPEGKAGAYTVPETVVNIDFGGCASLTSVTIGNGVKEIGDYAFTDCTSLTDVIVGNNVTVINGNAFVGCTSLKTITIKKE